MTYNELRSNNARRFNALNAQQQQSARDAGYRNRGKLAAIEAAAAILDDIERTIAKPVAVLEAAIARLDSASNRIVNARYELKVEADDAIARLNAIADEKIAITAPLQPAPETEDVPFRDWECRPSPGCGPLVEAIARSWNRHRNALHSAQQRVADAISQRIDRTLERLYPAPL